MKKILYLMHLPWDWIKQRPHFLAEELSAFCTVDVVYRFYRVPFEGKLVRNPYPQGIKLRPLVIFPLNRFAPIAALNALLLRGYLRKSIGRFDIVWCTHPEMFEAISKLVPSTAKVVYDCMDNHCAFDLARHNLSLTSRIRRSEQALLNRSDCIIASSQALQAMLKNQYCIAKPIHVVNNGIQLEPAMIMQPLAPGIEQVLTDATFNLTYIGTISSWFDFDLILAALKRFSDLTVLLVGPSEVVVPTHLRLRHLGPIPHNQIFTVMERSHALVMPFKVTELVRGVDPVKLYEYVASGKPAISVDYPEVRKFGDFVHLYRDKDEFLTLLDNLLSGTIGSKKPAKACREFAMENSWRRRAEKIQQLLGLVDVDA
jgi:glycosyltransferase involved in cell wall biosynthesis